MAKISMRRYFVPGFHWGVYGENFRRISGMPTYRLLDGNFLSLLLLYDIWKGQTGKKFNHYFKCNELSTRSHSLTLQLLSTTINAFLFFVVASITSLWNTVPEDIFITNSNQIKTEAVSTLVFVLNYC